MMPAWQSPVKTPLKIARTPTSAARQRNFGFAGKILHVWPKMLRRRSLRQSLKEWRLSAIKEEEEQQQPCVDQEAPYWAQRLLPLEEEACS